MGFRIVIVTFAILIDGLEMAIQAAMMAIGSTALGSVAGCALGQQYAGNIGCALAGAAGGVIGFLAQGTGAGQAIGTMLGYIVNIGITFTFGMVLLSFLIFSGNFKFFPTMYVFGLKMLPFLGIVPGWTWYAWHCTGQNKTVLAAARQKADRIKSTFKTPGHSFNEQTT